MTTIFLARHGESDWNVEKRFQGHRDRPLTERGREQAHALADLVGAEKIDAVYTSPLSRARETAEIPVAVLATPFEGTEERGVHHAEDRRVRANAQREREHGNHREYRLLQQPPQGKFHISDN